MRFWILQLIPHTGKTSFRPIFIVFIDHKIICHRVEELHILNGIDTLDTRSICDFSKKNLFILFSSLFKSFFSRCSFMVFFSLAMAWLLISALSLRYFYFPCNIIWNSVTEKSPPCIACEMILAMLSNLP